MQNGQLAKHHLRAFLERVRRRFPKASAFWRLEYQERGAVHFHLLFFNLPFWNADKIRIAWGECIGEENPHIHISVCRSRRKSTYYVSKYIAKANDDALVSLSTIPYPHVGRHWGVFNRQEIPMSELRLFNVFRNKKAFWDIKRAITHLQPNNRRSFAGGIMIYAKDTKLWENYWKNLTQK